MVFFAWETTGAPQLQMLNQHCSATPNVKPTLLCFKLWVFFSWQPNKGSCKHLNFRAGRQYTPVHSAPRLFSGHIFISRLTKKTKTDPLSYSKFAFRRKKGLKTWLLTFPMTCKKEQNMDSFREFEGKIHEEGWLLCISGVSFVSVLPLSKHTSPRLSSPVPSSEIVSKTDDVSEDSILLCGWVPNHRVLKGFRFGAITSDQKDICTM